jgi:hypothetical protein
MDTGITGKVKSIQDEIERTAASEAASAADKAGFRAARLAHERQIVEYADRLYA